MRLIDADALPWQVLWAWRAGEEVADALVYLTSGPLRLISGQP